MVAQKLGRVVKLVVKPVKWSRRNLDEVWGLVAQLRVFSHEKALKTSCMGCHAQKGKGFELFRQTVDPHEMLAGTNLPASKVRHGQKSALLCQMPAILKSMPVFFTGLGASVNSQSVSCLDSITNTEDRSE
jgi:hypothetical protein